MISTSKSVRLMWLPGITLVLGLIASATVGTSQQSAIPQRSVSESELGSAVSATQVPWLDGSFAYSGAVGRSGATRATASKANSNNGHSKVTSKVTGTKTINVRSEYFERDPEFDAARCRGFKNVPAAPPDCQVVMAGQATFTGSIQGVSDHESWNHPTSEGDHFEGVDVFDVARIEGCGDGGFTFDVHKGRLSIASYDPKTNTMMGYFTWSIRPRSGTGGLSGLISGEGEGEFKMYWSETGKETWGKGLITGTITCEGRGDDDDSVLPDPGKRVTIVRGEYVNDNALICSEVRPTSDPIAVQVTCYGGGAYWNGGFTGHTIVKVQATMDADGNLKGTYDDWFYGSYTGDYTVGELHFKGTFRTEGSQFFAEAKIVDGTCGFAGSTGTATYYGNGMLGEYKAEWIRPKTPVAPDPTCNPIDPNSLP